MASRLTPAAFDQQDWSWGYQILPYIDQAALWRNPDDDLVRSTPTVIYFCPSRRRPVVHYTPGNWGLRAMIDYDGNAGTSSLHGDNGGCYGDGTADGILVMQGSDSTTRIGGQTRAISLADVTDGASNTIMVGEKRMNADYYVFPAGGGEPDDDAGYVGGFQDDIVRFGALGGATPQAPYQALPPEPDLASKVANPATAQYYGYQFGSAHAGSAQFVFLRRLGEAHPLRRRSRSLPAGVVAE